MYIIIKNLQNPIIEKSQDTIIHAAKFTIVSSWKSPLLQIRGSWARNSLPSIYFSKWIHKMVRTVGT